MAHFLSKSLSDAGVTSLLQTTKEKIHTGRAAALICNPHRTLIADIGASKLLNPKALAEHRVSQALKSCDMVCVEGYLMTNCFSLVLELAHVCRSMSKTFAFCLSAHFVVQQKKQELLQLLPMCDIICGNRMEATELSKILTKKNQEVPSDQQLLKVISEAPKEYAIPLNGLKSYQRIVVVTNGSHPVISAKKKINGTVKICQEVPCPPVKILGDTTGAGDAFMAGFLAGVIHEESVENSIRKGVKYASQSLKYTGSKIDP